jgi:hypothetical protein
MAISAIVLDELGVDVEDELVVDEDDVPEPASVLPPQAAVLRVSAAATTVTAMRGFMSAISLCGVVPRPGYDWSSVQTAGWIGVDRAALQTVVR